jgi:hypothetical protein
LGDLGGNAASALKDPFIPKFNNATTCIALWNQRVSFTGLWTIRVKEEEESGRGYKTGLWTIRVKEEEESGRGYKTLRSTTDVNPS